MKDNSNMNPSTANPSRRYLIWGAGAAAAVAGVGVALWRFEPQDVANSASHPFWGQQFETPSGEALAMAGFQGKPLLLNFWATWCPPCIEELPMIEAFWRENTANGHQVVALAMAGLAGTELAKSLGNAAGGLPFTVFFKADGSIWRQKMGQLTPDDLSQWRSATL